jgi:hypothetical protein
MDVVDMSLQWVALAERAHPAEWAQPWHGCCGQLQGAFSSGQRIILSEQSVWGLIARR